MKRIVFALFACVVLANACQKEGTSDSPTVSFAFSVPTNVDGKSVLTLSVENYTGTDAITIPIEFSGDAVKDVDFTVEPEAFVIGGTSPVTTVTITPIDYTSEKSVTASIQAPEGFVAGRYMQSTFSLSGQVARCSFSTRSASLASVVTISVNLIDMLGENEYVLQDGDEIDVTVNTDESTAVENTHFRFQGEKKVVFSPATSSGTVTLEYISPVDAEHNKIVLELDPSSKYALGTNPEVAITIIGSEWEMIDGTWQIHELATNKEFMQTWWGIPETDLNGYPTFNPEDKFTVDMDNNMFIPAFQSEFKNYFIGTSNITVNVGEQLTLRTMTDLMTPFVIQLFWLDNVNRNFSANTVSDDKVGAIGVRFVEDEESGEQLLELQIVDYRATDFLKTFEDYGFYLNEKPVAANPDATDMQIRATFKKVE